MELREKAKFLLLWMEARENQRSASLAQKLLQTNLIGRIFLAWRYQVEKNQLSCIYFENNFAKRVMPLAFLKLK
jgi:hypothetical protein